MDNLLFEESVNTEIDSSEFISRKWVYVNDTNASNYTSQVVIDSTPLSNAGAYVSWQEGFIVMPLIIQLTSATAASLPLATTTADLSWALKAGFWQMINSMTVEFNNQNIVQQTPLTNIFRSFKALTSFSKDDLLNEGSTIGFSVDDMETWGFNTDTTGVQAYNSLSSSGVGFSNNRNAPALGLSAVQAYPNVMNGYNAGMYDRQQAFAYDPANCVQPTTAGTTQILGQGSVNNASACATQYRSYKQTQTVAGSIAWELYAKLRLKDLHDYFAKTPLLKGSTMRFYINTNQSITNFEIDAPVANVATPQLKIISSTVLGGLTQPLMLASAFEDCGCAGLAQDTYNLSCSIYKNNNSSQSSNNVGAVPLASTAMTACRLYAPVYKFSPLAEQRYLSLTPTKKIDYNDIFQFQFSNIAPGSFNFLVTNGIQNIQSVLVCPFISPTGAGGITNGTSYNTLLSPVCSSGATPDPIMLTNFNILVSGVNLFLNNEQYDYEQFNNELKSSNQLNGSLTTGLASGLISEKMFSAGMRYYYGNCARVLPAEMEASRSVQIIGTNSSLLTCNLVVFVEFKRSMTIDITTGARIA
jgi:hypothetical protein